MPAKLATLQIVGEISPCNQGVLVWNQLSGSKVTLTATRAGVPAGAPPQVREIGSGIAKSPSDTIPLDPDAGLEPDIDFVSAQQTKAGYEPSDFANGVKVRALPTDLNDAKFAMPVVSMTRSRDRPLQAVTRAFSGASVSRNSRSRN